MINFGAVPIGAVLPIFFDAFAGATGASITITGLATTDIEVYKGTSMTQRSSDAGYALMDTDGIDLDGVTGIHGFSIDTGDNTDAGFYTSGSFFTVVVSAITVDGQTVNFVAATFRCVTAEGVAGQPKVDVAAAAGTAITATGGRMEVNTTHAAGTAWGSGAITAGSIAADAITAAKIADGAIDAGAIATGAITAAKFAAGAIDATAIAANAITDAKVASDVTIASVTGSVGSVTGSVGSVTGAVGSVTGNVGGNVVGSVGSVTGLTNATIADAVWDEAQADHVAAGSFGITASEIADILVDTAEIGAAGAGLTALATQASVNTIDDFLDTEVAAILAAVDTEVAAIKAKTDNLPAAPAATGDIPSAASIADAVWDEAIAGHLGAGSTGEALNAAGAAGDPWTTTLPGAYGAGSAGYIIGNNIDAPISTVDTVVDAIKAKTDSLTFTVAGEVDANIQSVNDVTVNGTGASGSEWGP